MNLKYVHQLPTQCRGGLHQTTSLCIFCLYSDSVYRQWHCVTLLVKQKENISLKINLLIISLLISHQIEKKITRYKITITRYKITRYKKKIKCGSGYEFYKLPPALLAAFIEKGVTLYSTVQQLIGTRQVKFCSTT